MGDHPGWRPRHAIDNLIDALLWMQRQAPSAALGADTFGAQA
jgi:hypothetical protein